MGQIHPQTNFSAGILHGGAATLDNVAKYDTGLADAVNVNITNTGSLRVRDNPIATDIFTRPLFVGSTRSEDFRFEVYEDTSNNRYSCFLWHDIRSTTPHGVFEIANLGTKETHTRNLDSRGIHIFNENNFTIICQFEHQPKFFYLNEDVNIIELHDFTFKTIVSYVVEEENVNVDYTYEVDSAPWGDDSPSAVRIYNDRLLFAVGSTIYGSAVSQYTTGESGREVIFRRSAEIGEVVKHTPKDAPDGTEPEDLTIKVENIGEIQPDDSIETVLSGTADNLIFDLRSQNGLFAFSQGGNFYTPQEIIEPGKFIMQTVSNTPIKKVIPSLLERNFIYMRKSQGAPEAVMDFRQQFQGESYAFEEVDISVYVDTLLTDTIDIATTHGTTADTINIVYFLQADGTTIYCLHVNRAQNIFGWTRWELNVELLRIAAFENILYGINSTQGIFEFKRENIEEINWSITTLRPSLQFGNQYVSRNLQTSGWRIGRATIRTRGAKNNLRLRLATLDASHGTTISPRLFGAATPSEKQVFETLVQGNIRRGESDTTGITLSGGGGSETEKLLLIDRIDLDIITR